MKQIITETIIMVIGFCLGYVVCSITLPEPVKPPDQKIIYRDSLVRDTLWLRNDSIENEIEKEEKVHTELVDSILSADDSTNFWFFSDYIQNYNNK